MLVRITVNVEQIGEAYEVVDIGRVHRVGGVIGALLEELEREHPGVSMLEHMMSIRCEPAKRENDRPCPNQISDARSC
jgi:hypothetical protein